MIAAIVCWVCIVVNLLCIAVNLRNIWRNRRRARSLEIQTDQLARLWADFIIEKSSQ